MPRDINGAYTLPTGNPVVSGSPISSVAHNNTMNDVAAEMQDSLSRSGKGGMSVPMLVPDGLVSAPAYAFNNEASTGFYRPSANRVALAFAGASGIEFYQGNIDFAAGARVFRGRHAYKTADETVTSSSTVQNDDHLVLPVEANSYYKLELMAYIANVNDSGMRWRWTIPSGASGSATGFFAFGSSMTPLRHAIGGGELTQVATITQDYGWHLTGFVIVGGTAGNVQLQWAQENLSAGTTTLRAGSWLSLTKMN